MVDVDTALKASAYSGKKRTKEDGSKERVSKTLEPFDPAAAFEKEKADAWSTWALGDTLTHGGGGTLCPPCS